MAEFQLLSPSQQVARHLKKLLGKGRWTGLMPGTGSLAKEFPGVDRKAIGSALQQLVNEGWLQDQGVGKRRKILSRAEGKKLFRVGYLQYDYDGDKRFDSLLDEQLSRKNDVILEHTPNSMVGLKWNLTQITKMVESMDMDA